MKRLLVCLLVALAPATAAAKDITLSLNDDEQRALVQLLDTANRAGGIQNAEAVVHFVRKISEAQRATVPPPKAPKAD